MRTCRMSEKPTKRLVHHRQRACTRSSRRTSISGIGLASEPNLRPKFNRVVVLGCSRRHLVDLSNSCPCRKRLLHLDEDLSIACEFVVSSVGLHMSFLDGQRRRGLSRSNARGNKHTLTLRISLWTPYRSIESVTIGGRIKFALRTWFPRQGLVRENHSSRALDGDPENYRGCRLSSTKMSAHWARLPVSFSVISTFLGTLNARDVCSLHARRERASNAESTSRPTSTIATTSFNVTFVCRSSGH
jgi:hypothetical protein